MNHNSNKDVVRLILKSTPEALAIFKRTGSHDEIVGS